MTHIQGRREGGAPPRGFEVSAPPPPLSRPPVMWGMSRPTRCGAMEGGKAPPNALQQLSKHAPVSYLSDDAVPRLNEVWGVGVRWGQDEVRGEGGGAQGLAAVADHAHPAGRGLGRGGWGVGEGRGLAYGVWRLDGGGLGGWEVQAVERRRTVVEGGVYPKLGRPVSRHTQCSYHLRSARVGRLGWLSLNPGAAGPPAPPAPASHPKPQPKVLKPKPNLNKPKPN